MKNYYFLAICLVNTFSLFGMESPRNELLRENSATSEVLLYKALQKQDADTAQFLINLGIDHGRAEHGRYPALHVAVEAGNTKMVRYLLNRNAPLDAQDCEKRTVFDILNAILSSPKLTPKGRAHYEKILRDCTGQELATMFSVKLDKIPKSIRTRVAEFVLGRKLITLHPRATQQIARKTPSKCTSFNQYLSYNNITYGGGLTIAACCMWAFYFLVHASLLPAKYEA